MPQLGHEAGIEQDAEVLRDGRPAHLEMSRKRARGAGVLDEEVEHPAPCRRADCREGVGLAIGNHHHAANIRKRLLTCHAELNFAKGIGGVVFAAFFDAALLIDRVVSDAVDPMSREPESPVATS
jgi:hypothetical protein